MTSSADTSRPDRLRRDARLPQGPAAVAAVFEPLLAEAAGPGTTPLSLTLDYGAAGIAGEAVRVEAGLDRATRSLAFVSGDLLRVADGALLASASAVFRRAG